MNLKAHLTHPIFKAVSEVASEMGISSFVIGGFVRDLILKRESKDIDIVVLGNGLKVAEEVSKKVGVTKVAYYKNFGTAAFKFEDWEIEFVGARKESYERGSRKPVVEDGTLSDDQNRRRFS